MNPRHFKPQKWMIYLLVLSSWASAEEPARRIVAIGDLHGQYESFISLLQLTDLIDDRGAWTGGNAVFIQTGDILDRGLGVRAIMDVLRNLQFQAEKASGQVIVLMGNHEAMNILGVMRDVNPDALAQFADEGSESRRRKAFEAFLKQRRAATGEKMSRRDRDAFESLWNRRYPLGYMEYMEAMGPSGDYGRWLRSLPAAVVIDDILFVHGGIATPSAFSDIDALNATVKNHVQEADRLSQELIETGLAFPFNTWDERIHAARQAAQDLDPNVHPNPSLKDLRRLQVARAFLEFDGGILADGDGPLWFRGLATWEDEEGNRLLPPILQHFDVDCVVSGHTPQSGGIHERFGGRAFLIDTGLMYLPDGGGRASALEIKDDTFTAIYPDARERLVGPELPDELDQTPDEGADDTPKTKAPNPQSEPSTQRMPAHGPQRLPWLPIAESPLIAQLQPADASKAASGSPAPTFLGPDDQPLPFSTYEEILDFLENAKAVNAEVFGKGSTNPLRVKLERDGIRARAIFRYVDVTKKKANLNDDTTMFRFQDSYRYEVAAFHFNRLLGLDFVPPVVLRHIQGRSGSLQIWMENTFTEDKREERGLEVPGGRRWNLQKQTMYAFDYLIFNFDRNKGNILYDADWNLWFIDHTRSFRSVGEPKDLNHIIWCEAKLWKRLNEITDDELKTGMKKYLRPGQISAVIKRKEKLIAHFQDLIRQRGQSAVIITEQPPERETSDQ